MKDDPLAWQPVLKWAKSLTARSIGQLWMHHTGRDESHGYGDQTREWQMDVVMLMERAIGADVDVTFKLTFPKARPRSPENRSDFDEVVITLANDEWSYRRAARAERLPKSQQGALVILSELIGQHGTVSESVWREACIESRLVSTSEKRSLRKDAFNRVYRELVRAEKVFVYEDGARVQLHKELDYDFSE
jgi:hypothetical protein